MTHLEDEVGIHGNRFHKSGVWSNLLSMNFLYLNDVYVDVDGNVGFEWILE